MSGEIEAAGAAVTAGLAAGAMEQGEGGASAHEHPCSNCGYIVNGKFCANCGQPAHLHRSLLHMFEEVLHGVFHFDTKFWRTLPKLVFRPGTLTRDFVHGKRARYVSPLALFLFVIFLMFFVFSLTGGPNITPQVPATAEEAAAQARERLRDAQGDRDEAAQDLAAAQRGLAEARRTGDRRDIADAEQEVAKNQKLFQRWSDAVAQAEAAVAEAGAARANAQAATGKSAKAAPDLAGKRVKGAVGVTQDGEVVFGAGGDVDVAQLAGSPEKTWQDKWRDALHRGDVKVNFGNDKLNKKVLHKLENPDLVLYKLQQTAYKFSFLLVPISLPFVAILFLWRRGLTLFDHTVFVLYSLSFVSLMFIGFALLAMAPGDLDDYAWPILVFGIPVHMLFQLKGAYALGWFSAIWRTWFLMWFALIDFALFCAAIVFLGLTG